VHRSGHRRRLLAFGESTAIIETRSAPPPLSLWAPQACLPKLQRPTAPRPSAQQLAAQRRTEQPADGEGDPPQLRTLPPRADPAALFRTPRFREAFGSPLRPPPPAAAAGEPLAPGAADAAAGRAGGAAEAPAAPSAALPASAALAPLPSLGLLASHGYSFSPSAAALQALHARDPGALAAVEGFCVSREGVRCCAAALLCRWA
jgi:hypothetical protein